LKASPAASPLPSPRPLVLPSPHGSYAAADTDSDLLENLERLPAAAAEAAAGAEALASAAEANPQDAAVQHMPEESSPSTPSSPIDRSPSSRSSRWKWKRKLSFHVFAAADHAHPDELSPVSVHIPHHHTWDGADGDLEAASHVALLHCGFDRLASHESRSSRDGVHRGSVRRPSSAASV